jgi:hypothetical protein
MVLPTAKYDSCYARIETKRRYTAATVGNLAQQAKLSSR